ncbi:MAG: hypothetical protein JJT78_17405 [Leptospira sp.]|nr:hypothetical protein [Leptospira sp.]
MNETILFLPILLQLATAVLILFFWNHIQSQKLISIFSNLATFFLAGLLLFAPAYSESMFVQAGNWMPPFGISIVADTLTKVMVALTSIVGLAVSVYSYVGIGNSRARYGFYPSFHFLIMGLMGAFLTGDIFNLYVWFEIVIISSFVLVSLGADKERLQASIPYVSMNLLASVIFLTGIGILYGLTGSLNMADLSIQVANIENRSLVQVCAVFFIVGFGMKSAAFPLYFWLPSSYHTPPSAIASLFGGLLTKLGIYALIRVFTLIFIPDFALSTLLEWIAVLTLFTGAVGALIQTNLRKMFSYIIVCHIGFMLAGLSLHTNTSLTGTIYYLIHDIPAKANLFLIAGLIYRLTGSYYYKDMGGLQKSHPLLSFITAVALFSVAGIPPLSGFFPKIFLFRSSLYLSDPLTVSMILASFLTLFSFAKMWKEVFWKEHPTGKELNMNFTPSQWIFTMLPILFLLAISLFIGLGAEYITKIAQTISGEILDPNIYIDTVFPKGGSF